MQKVQWFILMIGVFLLLGCGGLKAVTELSDGVLRHFSEGDKWGFVNQNGKVIVPARYTAVGYFHEGLALVCEGGTLQPEIGSMYYSPSQVEGGKWGLVNDQGIVVISPRYADAKQFSRGLIWVRAYAASGEAGLWGLVNASGEWRMEAVCDTSVLHQDGYSAGKMAESGLWGIVDRSGSWTETPQYDGVRLEEKGRATVQKDKKTWLIDAGNSQKLAGPFSEVRAFHGYGAMAIFQSLGGRYGFLDESGKILVAPRYDRLYNYYRDRAAFKKAGKWGFLDLAGEEVIPARFDQVDYFEQEGAAVEMDGKFGLIDASGREIIPVTMDGSTGFSQGYGLICTDCKPIHSPSGEPRFPDHFVGGRSAIVDSDGKVYPVSGTESQLVRFKRYTPQPVLEDAGLLELTQMMEEIEPVSLADFLGGIK